MVNHAVAVQSKRESFEPSQIREAAKKWAGDERYGDIILRLLTASSATAHLPPSLPHGIIHMDWNSTNILWHEDGSLSCVLDFEFATWGPLVFDVAFLVLEFCSEADDLRNHRRDKTTEQQTVSCNATKGSSSESALVNAYSKVRSMTVQELALLRPSIALLGLRSIPWLLENNFHDYLRAFTAKLEKFL